MSFNSPVLCQLNISRLPSSTHDPASEQAAQGQDEVASPLTYQKALDELRNYGSLYDPEVTRVLDDLATMEKTLGENHPDVADALKSVAQRCIYILEKYKEAEALNKRALEIHEAVHEKDHLDVTELLKDLAWSCLGQKRYEEAERYCRRAIDIYETKLAADDLSIAYIKDLLGSCYFEQKKYREAEKVFRRALEIYELKLDPNDFLVTSAKSNLDSCKKYIEAEELEKRKESTAHKRTSDTIDADNKSTNSQGRAATKKAKIVNTVDPRATSSATLVVALTKMRSSSSDEAESHESRSLKQAIADARAKTAEIDRQLIDRINEINQNSHSNLKRRIEELQAKNANQNEKLCRASRKIEDLLCSQSTYERLIAEQQAELDENARHSSSKEKKIKVLVCSRQAILAKSAKLEAEIGEKAQQLSEAKATIETSERKIAELKAEIAEKSRQLAEAEQTIESHLSCSICKDEDANRMWSQCNHVATCEQCASKLLRKDKGNSGNGVACPICQTLGFPLKVFI